MSSLIVEICNVDEVRCHPNAENLDIIRVKGWEICVRKNTYFKNNRCVYFPPDSVIPLELSDKLDITKYLRKGRVCVTNLRGVPSYGTVMKYDGPNPTGFDMAEELGITKWEPPVKATNGDAARPDTVFHTYYSMENLRNFPDAFQEGEEIEVTEKLHGENVRVGIIQTADENGNKVWSFVAGSHNVQRKQFVTKEDGTQEESVFWKALSPNIKSYLAWISGSGYHGHEIESNPVVRKDLYGSNVIMFGERFGVVQDLHYGMNNGEFEFRWFDMTYNANYISCSIKSDSFLMAKAKQVPIIYRGPFIMEKMIELASGFSTIDGKTIREGIVITSAIEQECVTAKRVLKRKQFKLINPDYLTRKNGTEFH